MSIKHQSFFSKKVVRHQVLCEEDVVVEFVLTDGNTIESMNVNIYAPVECDFEDDIALIGNLIIKDDNIIYEYFPDDPKGKRYYLIGMECVNRVRNNPSSILG